MTVHSVQNAARPRASSLDTQGITRRGSVQTPGIRAIHPLPENDPDVPVRWQDDAFLFLKGESFFAKIERITLKFRRRKAMQLIEKAKRREREALRAGKPMSSARRDAKWHYDRAKGQAERFKNVAGCGRDNEMVVRCTCCGHEHAVAVHCGVDVLCLECRGRRAHILRARFMQARLIHLAKERARFLMHRPAIDPLRGKRGCWTEKMMTLTGPHVGTLEERIGFLFDAFPIFRRKLRAYIEIGRGTLASEVERLQRLVSSGMTRQRIDLRRQMKQIDPNVSEAQVDSGIKNLRTEAEEALRRLRQERRMADSWADVLWERSFEWSVGDGEGHPHWHVWIFCPYLEQKVIAELWREAMIDAGVSEDSMPRTDKCPTGVIVDIRKVLPGEKGAAELIKYMTKDLLPDGERLSPETMARLYMSLDGRRRTQSSKGFFGVLAKGAKCPQCGQRDAMESIGIRKIGETEIAPVVEVLTRSARRRE